jgi:hypothetical protein
MKRLIIVLIIVLIAISASVTDITKWNERIIGSNI